MPSREEIRKIDKQIAQSISSAVLEVDWESDDPKDDAVLAYYRCAKDIRTRLDKLGVVIKVDREVPDKIKGCVENAIKAGYSRWESLIDEAH